MNFLDYFTFNNIIVVFSICMIITALLMLIVTNSYAILSVISIQFLELIMYTSFCYGAYVSQDLFGSEFGYIWGFLFAMGLTATTLITSVRIKRDNSNIYTFLIINVMIHGLIGMYLKSTLICAVSVIFLMIYMHCHCSYFPNMKHKTTDINHHVISVLTSGTITISGLLLHIYGMNETNYIDSNILLTYVRLFIPGMLWLGPYILFISLCLISSFKYYGFHNDRDHKLWFKNKSQYIASNIFTVICTAIAILIGHFYDIPQLSGISGTVFVISLFKIFFDFCYCRGNNVMAWSFLIIGIILYLTNVYLRKEIEKYGIYKYFHLMPSTYLLLHIFD